MSRPWNDGPLLGFDTETTGTDVWGDRIVTAALVYKADFGSEPIKYEFMVNIGQDIPEAATKIHGITNEMMIEQGLPAVQVLGEINMLIHEFVAKGAMIVAYNAPYDLTLLRQDTLRSGTNPTPALSAGCVLDPLVIDKQTDKYRKGKRNLSATAEFFGIDSAGAHGALADVIMTMRVAYKLAGKYEKLRVEPSVIHGWQKQWRETQSLDYQTYLRKSKPDAIVDGSWPIEPERAAEDPDGVQW